MRTSGVRSISDPEELSKRDIVNALARRYDYRSLLEISTPYTGFTQGAFDRAQLTRYDRLIYRYDGVPDDGEYTVRTAAETSYEFALERSERPGGDGRYDVAFVDPFHTHHCTTVDLLVAFALVRPGGAIVVHDCHPVDSSMVSPTYIGYPTAWCGVTYWAFIDFVLGRAGIEYFTVDADYGCGVIRKVSSAGERHDPMLELDWRAAAASDAERFAFYRRHEAELLHLISAQTFNERFDTIASA